MRQRTLARMSLFLMSAGGVLLLASIYIIPIYAQAFSDISDGQLALPKSTRIIFDFSNFAVQHGLLLCILYGVLFIGVIVWFCTTKQRSNAD